MKKLLLLCFSLCMAMAAQAQLPSQAKVISEIKRIYSGGQGIFQSWKGGLARNLGTPEYESMYTFPGTIDPRICQVPNAKPPVYYYEGTLTEGKSATEIKRLLKDWETLLSDSTVTTLTLLPIAPGVPDEKGLSTMTFSVSAPDKVKDTARDPIAFRIHFDYEQADDDGLYSAIIQIGYL